MSKKSKKMKTAAKAKSSKKPASSKKSAVSKSPSKLVYYFGNGKADGDGSMKSLLGGKGANLAEMTKIGLPVPPGFTITTEVCTYFYANKRTYPKALKAQTREVVAKMEKI
ncbi:PEP/pyruvate-binding domain-containing protein [Oscillatoria amoena NRMC-F 0135]|nr:PEP/pyruvate-binding domain-containing protein [Oscillatoria amoena NRMC-F 0135]